MKTLDELDAISSKIVAQRQSYQLLKFNYPIELLCFLIKKHDMNIYDVPIAELTARFIEYVREMEGSDLDAMADFYATAAELLCIKSKMLLPQPVESNEDEAEDPRAELVEKLIEFQRIKKLSQLMEEKENEAEWSLERKKSERVLPFDEAEVWEPADSLILLQYFSKIIDSFGTEKILDLHEDVSINEKIALMEEFFESRGECFFTDLIVRTNSVLDVVCAFMAILEAVKFKKARILQNRIYTDIKIMPCA